MSLADQDKWNARYRDGAYAGRRHPTALLARFAPSLPRGQALDVACGAGRNALFLAEQGFVVDAVDISAEGLARLDDAACAACADIRTIEADLESGLPVATDGCYDLIVMVRYVNLPLIRELTGRLGEHGILVSEQHLKTDQDVVGPRNAAYRLDPGALLDAVRPLRVHYYREGIVTDPDGSRAALARVVASGPRAGLLED